MSGEFGGAGGGGCIPLRRAPISPWGGSDGVGGAACCAHISGVTGNQSLLAAGGALLQADVMGR